MNVNNNGYIIGITTIGDMGMLVASERKSRRMKIIQSIIITVLIVFSGYKLKSQVENDIIGKYQRTGSLGFKANIELLPDSTFVYKWYIGMMRGETIGTWRMEGNKVTLNSNRQPSDKKPDYTYISTFDSLRPISTIKVQTEEGINVPTASCIVYSNGEKFESTTDSLGTAIFSVYPVEIIRILFIGFKPIDFRNDNLSNNRFTFLVQVVEDSYHYFTNEKWKLKKGRLYDKSIKKDRWRNKYYEKKE